MIRIIKDLKKHKVSGIYMIKNQVNGKVYIGRGQLTPSRRGISHRVSDHLNNLRGKRHCNKHLQNAWNKYGESKFTVSEIERVIDGEEMSRNSLMNLLMKRESYYIEKYNSADQNYGYNVHPTGYGPTGFVYKPLSENQIIDYVNYYRVKNRKLPTKRSGIIPDTGITWDALDRALRIGSRNLSGNESLHIFLQKHFGIKEKPKYAIELIKKWMEVYYKQHGKYPGNHSGPVEGCEDDGWRKLSWAGIDSSIHKGFN